MFLSARKAQHWLLRNYGHLDAPVRAQFGTTINLQAGKVKRAPPIVRKLGFEWLWRIKEEPYLWRRYLDDGVGLFWLLLTRIGPLAVGERLSRSSKTQLQISRKTDSQSVHLKLSGAAVISHIDMAIADFRAALDARKPIVIDLSGVSAVDSRFLGLLIMLRKQAVLQGCALRFVNPSPRVRKKFRRSSFEFLLEAR